MKICLINNLYKPYNHGGAESIVEISAKQLIKDNNKVFIITTKPNFQSLKNDTQSSIKKYYLPSSYYNLNKIPFFLRLFWHIWDMFDVVSYFKVKKILEKEKPDKIITHNLKGISFLIPRLIKKLNIKHTHFLHDIQLIHPSGLMLYGRESKIDSLSVKIYAQICKHLFKSVNTVISPSKWLLKMHASRGFFKNSKKEIAKQTKFNQIIKTKKYNNFLYVGQIEEHKGILFLVNVFEKLNYKLTIVGDGSKLETIKKQAKNNKNIKIIGKKNKKEVQKIMKKADCLIVPSICYENAPTVIYEAISANLPIIASRIGGIPELISDKFLFEPGNEEKLISIISNI